MIVGTDGVHAHPSLPLDLRQIIRLNLELANKPDGSYDNSVPKTLSASLMFGAKRPRRLNKVIWSRLRGLWGSGSRHCCSFRWSQASSSVCHNDKWGRHGETVEGGRETGERRSTSVPRCILYSEGMYVHHTENANKRVWVGICDNDRLSPHSDVEPEPALILIHYLYFPRLADCANRTQHTHGRHTNGDGACGAVSFTGQCLTLTAQNEPIYCNNNMTKYWDEKKSLHWATLHFNGRDISYYVLRVSGKKPLHSQFGILFTKLSPDTLLTVTTLFLDLKATDPTNVLKPTTDHKSSQDILLVSVSHVCIYKRAAFLWNKSLQPEYLWVLNSWCDKTKHLKNK